MYILGIHTANYIFNKFQIKRPTLKIDKNIQTFCFTRYNVCICCRQRVEYKYSREFLVQFGNV